MMADGWSGAELDRLGRAMLEAAADAIILADREGVIRFWNAGAERLFGFTPAEALGRPLDIIVPEPQRARHWAGFSQVMETGESRYGAGEVLAVPGFRKDGSRISLEFTIVPLQDQAGQMEGMAAILRDVTRRFEQLRALRRQVAAARESRAPPSCGTPPCSMPTSQHTLGRLNSAAGCLNNRPRYTRPRRQCGGSRRDGPGAARGAT
jgi:PAS domain S-box-containing protein